jgi:hypothetical protein
MIYELRTYEAIPGRLPALCKRFETATMNIWKRHGIVPIGFWTTLIGQNNQYLYYLLQWESLADREQRWAAFQADPEWLAARNESQKNGVLQSVISNIMLEPTSFSALQ